MTTDTARTENDALIEALATSALAEELAPGSIYAFKHADRVTQIDLTDKHLPQPRRKTGRIVVDDAASFTHYYKKHADSGSETYVSIDHGRVTAILNAHEATPNVEFLDEDNTARWGDHQLVLNLAQTDAWKRWTGRDRQLIRQADFADFIDDNRADIRKPSAADMLELVQHFQTQTRVTFNSAAVLANGNKRLVFTEETDAGAGAKGQIEVPGQLELVIAPFEDSARLERQRNQLARELDAARAALRDLGQKPGPVGWVPLPELLREKARADALADRVQQLQEANMAHDRAAPH
ncbi:MAG: DUF2303 family protein [Streptomycetaceae bacterium]|nr:DUF2303 family protein [Streptomycetaceae bacterium]